MSILVNLITFSLIKTGSNPTIGHISDVEQNVVLVILHLLGQSAQCAAVDVAQIAVNDKLWRPLGALGKRLEPVQRAPALVRATVVLVPGVRLQVPQVHSVDEHEALQRPTVGELAGGAMGDLVQGVTDAELAAGGVGGVEGGPGDDKLILALLITKKKFSNRQKMNQLTA